jgi:branched-chain amino acid transport system ATP-binding protein
MSVSESGLSGRESGGPLLSLREVEAGYGGKAVIHGVSLELPEGGSMAVVGPNGSGKSTLLKTVAGLARPLSGTVSLRGVDIGRLDPWRRARSGLAYVPQERNVFQNLSVLENLLMGLEALPEGRERGLRDERVQRALETFPGLAKKLRSAAGHLSGGQRQMLAMASALMQDPVLLLLDEPSAGLSPANAAGLFESVVQIKAGGVGLMIIEQNVKLGLAVADVGVVLAGGRVRLVAEASELTFERLHQFYLGAGS